MIFGNSMFQLTQKKKTGLRRFHIPKCFMESEPVGIIF